MLARAVLIIGILVPVYLSINTGLSVHLLREISVATNRYEANRRRDVTHLK